MNSFSRIRNILFGGIMIFASIMMMVFPDVGYIVIALLLGLSLTIDGISTLVYYFTMARYMVGGKRKFYTGKVTLDIGVFALSIAMIPQFLIMLSLQVTFGVSGAISLFSGISAKKAGAMHWKGKVIHGIICIGIMLICIIFSKETIVTVWVFSITLIYSALQRIFEAFRRTSIAYIQ